MVRMGEEAARWALSQRSWRPSGLCQQFTRSAFGVGAYYGSAASAWHNAKKKHPTDNYNSIPRGVPVFWLGGSRGFGHAAVSLGNGYVRSTDWPYRYSVGTARIEDINRSWGQNFVGWTEDINTVTVWVPPKKVHALNAAVIAKVTRNEGKSTNSRLLKRAVAKEVGKGNMNLNHGKLGPGFRKQYAEVQRKYLRHQGVTPRGNMDDGIPGPSSLRWLGKRHGFEVTDD